jgi:hypothetical protein
MPRTPKTKPIELAQQPSPPDRHKGTSKLDTLAGLLCQESGVTVAELCAATGWRTHSVRGAMAGALKKRGLVITSTKADGERRYAAQPEAAAQ